MDEVKAVIKDAIFERVMMGDDIRMALRRLHFEDGFSREAIMEAYNEMVQEAWEGDEE